MALQSPLRKPFARQVDGFPEITAINGMRICVCVCSWLTGWPTSSAAEQPLSEAAESIMLFKGLVRVSMPWTPGSASHCDTKGSSTETTIDTGAPALGLKIQPVMLPGETEPRWALGCREVTATKACESHCEGPVPFWHKPPCVKTTENILNGSSCTC